MIARKSALIIFTQITNGFLGYIALFFIARYMSPWEYGVVGFAYGFVTIFQLFGDLGFNFANIKKISEGKNLGRCIGTFLTAKIGLIGIMTSIVIGAVLFWKIAMGRGFESSTHELAIYIMLGYSILHILARSFRSIFQARQEVAKADIPLFFGTLFRVVFTIYIAILGFGALALALTYVIGDIAFFLSSLYFLRKYPINKLSRKYLKDYSKFAFPMAFVASSMIIMNNIDKVLIQLFWSATDVGYYFAAFRLSHFINMFTIAVGVLLLSTFSSFHTNKNIAGIKKLIFQSERYLSMIVFPIVFGLVLFAEPAVKILLSNAYIPAIPVLQILPFFALFAALERPYQSQFIGMNKPKLARNRILIMVFLNVILNLILIPKDIQMFGIKLAGMGATGAAIATVISYAVGLIYSRIIAWKITKIKGNTKILLHAIAAFIMSITIYIMLYKLDIIYLIIRWYHLLLFALLGLGIYISILFLMKEFTKKDFDFFLDTLNIKKMLIYIKDEMRRK